MLIRLYYIIVIQKHTSLQLTLFRIYINKILNLRSIKNLYLCTFINSKNESMSDQSNFIEKEDVVVKFCGDSGDGMQLAGTLFSDAAALIGLDLATFPDYPAEIRAPHNTIAGVSGFQVHVGRKKIETSGDFVDILVAMNPASLKSNLKWTRPGLSLIHISEPTRPY